MEPAQTPLGDVYEPVRSLALARDLVSHATFCGLLTADDTAGLWTRKAEHVRR